MTTEQRAAKLRALVGVIGFDALVVLLTDPARWFDDNAADLAGKWEDPHWDPLLLDTLTEGQEPRGSTNGGEIHGIVDPLAWAVAGADRDEVTAALRVALGDGFAAETATS